MKLKPEELIQSDCVNFTRIMCPNVLLVASMNGMCLGGMRNPGAYIAKMKMLGMRTGDLDIRLHWRRVVEGTGALAEPLMAYIELKAGKNMPTDEQIRFMEDLDKIGIPHGWTNSLGGYVDLLRDFKVPMRSGIYGHIRIP